MKSPDQLASFIGFGRLFRGAGPFAAAFFRAVRTFAGRLFCRRLAAAVEAAAAGWRAAFGSRAAPASRTRASSARHPRAVAPPASGAPRRHWGPAASWPGAVAHRSAARRALRGACRRSSCSRQARALPRQAAREPGYVARSTSLADKLQCTTRAVSVRMASNRFMPLICRNKRPMHRNKAPPGRNRVQDKVAIKEKLPTEPPKVGTVDIEQFSRNIARMVEEGGKALAAYLKPREEGAVKAEPADEIADVVKTLGHVAEYWLSDPQRAVEVQASLGKAYLELWAAAVKRMAGEPAPPVVEPDPRDKRFADPEWSSNQFYDFLKQAYLLTTQWADRLVTELGRRCAHAAQGGVLRAADRQRGLALELRAHQSGADARDAVVERREPGARHAHAGRGHRGRPGQPEDPPVRCVEIRGRQKPRAHARQGDLPERADAADPVCAGDRDGAAAPAADHPALDQQVLHPRSQSGEVLHQVVRRSRPHRVRDLLGQSRRASRDEELRGLHARGSARRARRDQGGRPAKRPSTRSAIASAGP